MKTADGALQKCNTTIFAHMQTCIDAISVIISYIQLFFLAMSNRYERFNFAAAVVAVAIAAFAMD